MRPSNALPARWLRYLEGSRPPFPDALFIFFLAACRSRPFDLDEGKHSFRDCEDVGPQFFARNAGDVPDGKHALGRDFFHF